MIYIDTSVIVAAFTAEEKTEQAQQFLTTEEQGPLCVSSWTLTEFASAISLKIRQGTLTELDRAKIQSTWHQAINENFIVLSITQSCYEAATIFVGEHTLGLRAADALHIAIAAETGASLATFDKKMALAAVHFGVPLILSPQI
jgi:uncharacterized protein